MKALILRDDAILLNRSQIRQADGTVQDVYDLPGGGQEFGETQEQALVRECREEIGAEIRVHGAALVFELQRRGTDRGEVEFQQVNVAFWAELREGEVPGLGPEPDHAQLGTAWLPIARLDRYVVYPPAVAAWLRADPGSRPFGLGMLEIPPVG
ncbi:NUDIX domain-containing protein [Brachybacterium hainanense]|uniref:NUDIX domain-containing protein n=1 Tax=Brachybacterium hainanense TaxID=1541174 RepID=A0ABV6R648_9MICO